MQMNVQLIRASQFLYGFCLSVRHKPGNLYVVFDTLSRLESANANLLQDPNHSELDVLFAYTVTLVNSALFCLGGLSAAIG